MHITSNSYEVFPTNTILSAGSGVLAFFMSLEPALPIILPIAFFIVGKAIDVAVKVYLEKRK
jgi:hypothetical protein